ncbi:cytochrome P450 [Nocardioides sp. InS609-2]|uniref:cytochrome P450 n=1 Tax=Nocardioides sp. InS609-2 TaxID=2760705 RepID=UPI0020C14DCC|nr:cytochrome P450 [Nocardioides sp. InS609-2]
MEPSGVRYHDELDCYVVWGLEPARAAMADPALTSDTFQPMNLSYLPEVVRDECPDLVALVERWFIFRDGADHQTARKAVRPLFSPRNIRDLAPEVATIVEDVLDEAMRSTEFDFVTEVADKVAARAIALILGFESASQESLQRWGLALSKFLGASYRPDFAMEAQVAIVELSEFVRSAESAPGGLLSLASGEREDRVATAAMMVFGGLQTTVGLLGFACKYMMESDVSPSTVGERSALIERTLSHWAPLGHVARMADRATSIASTAIPEGSAVLIALDGTDVLDRPGMLTWDPELPSGGPGPLEDKALHLAFGYGVHRCIGAPLARLVGDEVVRQLVEKAPGARVVSATPKANRTYRGFSELVVRIPG